MIGSLNTGVAALKSFQRGIEVVGNDIANANTVGFKSQRVEYKESFFNVLNRSFTGDGNPNFGVTSTANQVGMGVSADTISTDFGQGSIDSTGIETDVAILGHGFFKVVDESIPAQPKEQFTRAGNFRIDENGFLVTQEGKFVQGQTVGDAALSLTATGTSDGQGTPAQGFSIEASNINTAGGTISLGALTLPADFNGGSGYFSTANGAPKISIIGDGSGAEAEAVVTDGVVTGINITNAGTGFSNAVIRIEEPPANNLVFTKTEDPALGEVGKIRIQVPTLNVTSPEASATLSQANVTSLAPGLESFGINPQGDVEIILSNGEKVRVGRILLQRFKAPQNLTRLAGGFYENAPAAGIENAFNGVQGIPGGSGLGILRQGSLELSNSDMADNFAHLITTQRSFQGAARIITTSDEIIREAVNLKR